MAPVEYDLIHMSLWHSRYKLHPDHQSPCNIHMVNRPNLDSPISPKMSSVFLVLEPSKVIFLYRMLYPKRRIESYSILGTIVSPNKILVK